MVPIFFLSVCLWLQGWRAWIITPYWLRLREFWCASWWTPSDMGESLTCLSHYSFRASWKKAWVNLQRLPLKLKSEHELAKGLLMLSKHQSKCLVYWMAAFWQCDLLVSLQRSRFFLKTLVAQRNWRKWHSCACANVY